VPDEALRRLARAAAAGDLDARARLLVERGRSGTLRRERLILAAHLGDPAARAAAGATGAPLPVEARLAYALSHLDGSPTYLRWALDCAARAADTLPEELVEEARDALSVARRALEEPIGDAERRRVVRLSHDLRMRSGGRAAPPAADAVYHAVGTLVDRGEVASAVGAAALAAGSRQREETAWQVQRLTELLLE
jgi:hypothetical protein